MSDKQKDFSDSVVYSIAVATGGTWKSIQRSIFESGKENASNKGSCASFLQPDWY